MLHVDAIRRPSVGYREGGAFPDPTTRLIDDERRGCYTAEGTHFESAYYLALTYRPPAEAARPPPQATRRNGLRGPLAHCAVLIVKAESRQDGLKGLAETIAWCTT
jgi:hypothetical protein